MVAIVSFGMNYEIRQLPVTVSSTLFDKRKAWKQDTPLRAMNLQANAISIFCNASAALVTHISGLPGGELAHEPRVILAGKQDICRHFRRCYGEGKGAWCNDHFRFRYSLIDIVMLEGTRAMRQEIRRRRESCSPGVNQKPSE